ncbi:glycoside hydrolase family 6 protein [Cellulomonas sp. NPDC055163]
MSQRTKAAALLSASLLAVTGIGAVTATSAQAAAGCKVDYAVTNQWGGGFGANVTVTNLGDPVSSWSVDWTFPSGQSIQQLWNGVPSQSGAAVTVKNMSWNGNVGTGGTASFGFNGSWSGANGAPTAFRLNGVACTGAPVSTPTPTQTSTPTPTPTPTVTPTTTPVPSGTFWVNPNTQAATAAAAASGDNRRLLEKISTNAAGSWIGNWNSPSVSQQEVRTVTQAAAAKGQTALLVIYAIPGRDCGNHSSGGVATSEYAGWIDQVAAGIVGKPWIVLEPDALAQLGDCDGQGDRVGYLKYAAQKLTQAGGRVYIDAGHSAWLSPSVAAQRLNQIGWDYAVGFALNTSNYRTTAESRSYGQQISQLTGGKTFVIDTSRNGNGPNGSEWCNPSGRALGEKPALVNSGGLDATLWVKLPGESDGACNGGPAAGQWFQSQALELARNAKW